MNIHPLDSVCWQNIREGFPSITKSSCSLLQKQDMRTILREAPCVLEDPTEVECCLERLQQNPCRELKCKSVCESCFYCFRVPHKLERESSEIGKLFQHFNNALNLYNSMTNYCGCTMCNGSLFSPPSLRQGQK